MNLAPNLSLELAARIPTIAQRSDYYRTHLLAAQGGLWLDIDAVVFGNVGFVFEAIDQGRVVARRNTQGRMSNNFIGAPAGSPLVDRWIEAQEAILVSLSQDELPWNALGAGALTELCLEGQSDVELVRNEMVAPIPWTGSSTFLSRFTSPADALANAPVTVMLYNSRFPDSLRALTEERIMRSSILLSRLLRIALGESSLEEEHRSLDAVGRRVESALSEGMTMLARARERLHTQVG